MSKYLNDPREMSVLTDEGITLENDNRYEPMYHWGAMVLDICGLPVKEYMRNPFIEGIDSGKTTRQSVKFVGTLVSPKESTLPYTIKINWLKPFGIPIMVGAKLNIDGFVTTIGQNVTDSDAKEISFEVPYTTTAMPVKLLSFIVAESGATDFGVAGKPRTIIYDEENRVEYDVQITTEDNDLDLTLYYRIWDTIVQKVHYLRFKEEIPPFTGSTEQEGFIFKGWKDEDGNEYTTMPSRDLTLYATYQKIDEPDIYYGIFANSALTLANLEAKAPSCDHYEFIFEVPVNKTIEDNKMPFVPQDEFDEKFDWEKYADGDEEFLNWWRTNYGYSFVIFVPTVDKLSEVHHGSKDTLNFVGTAFEKNIGTVTINGTQYNAMAYCNQSNGTLFCMMDKDDTYPMTMVITVIKK